MVAWVGLFDSYPAERMVWGECYSLANPLTVQPQAPITAGRISTSDRGRTGTFSLLGRRVPGHTSEPRNLPAGVYVGPGGNGTVVRVRLP
jgi:hypothetical protein